MSVKGSTARHLIFCLFALLLVPGTALAAEETHFFNATLSLTGDCSTSSLDPVPDPSCPGGPPSAFLKHGAVAVDAHGDRYVLSRGGDIGGAQARIDIFDSSGHFLTELAVPGAETLTVDSLGHLYVMRGTAENKDRLIHYAPSVYSPDTGEIEYAVAPVPIPRPNAVPEGEWPGGTHGLAINMANNHLFVAAKISVQEFGSAAEGNPWEGGIQAGSGILDDDAYSIAIDPARGRIYVSDAQGVGMSQSEVKIIELEEPHQVIGTIDGSTSPYGQFTGTSFSRFLPVAVDEETGHVFIGDLKASTNRVYEFEPDGTFVSAIEHDFKLTGAEIVQIAVDNGPTSPTRGYLFVPSGSTLPGHSYAFEPKKAVGQPVVETATVRGITEDEAILRGKVNPGGSAASYRFEYTTEQRFLTEGFTGAVVAGGGTLKAGGEGIAVQAPATGLAPETFYRFRLVAESEGGKDEAEMSFTTYGPQLISSDCPNQGLRTRLSATLPDCRAYELVTPANTGGHLPYGQEYRLFPARLSSRAGDVISFQADGGAIPGTDAPGSGSGDRYLMTRSGVGWRIESAAPSPAISSNTIPYGGSLDQGYSVFNANGEDNPSAIDGKETFYLRYPDGHFEVLGQGSLGIEPLAIADFITENGSHIIFSTSAGGARLEPDATEGTITIYDRTPDGITHVVSLLPGEVSQKAGEGADFLGTSLDGRGVAFGIADKLYLRRDNAQTFEVASGAQFVGVAEGGGRAFYVAAGQVLAFDAETETVIPFTSPSAQATVVNVATGGDSVYFVSPKKLVADRNPDGDLPQVGGQNLYLGREGGALSFVGTVTEEDVVGEPGLNVGERIHGLGLWAKAFGGSRWGAFALDPSRSTPDGMTLLFESRAPLTAGAGEGQRQIYRYDEIAETLRCLSCNPTGVQGGGDAALQVDRLGAQVLTEHNAAYNLRDDGDRAFFETTEPLVLADVDGLNDVYEWEEQGVGSCRTAGGCIYLISSGSSGDNDYLYAVSDSGDDVFFRTGDLLLPEDTDATPSIYDARVGGGFPPPPAPAGECLGEACQPAVVAPNDPTPASAAFLGQGNAVKQRCPKGKHRVRKGDRTRCVRKNKQHKPKRASAKRRSHR
jgi:hypothetical protein